MIVKKVHFGPTIIKNIVGHNIIKPKDNTDSKLCEKILELDTIFPQPHNSFFANISVSLQGEVYSN